MTASAASNVHVTKLTISPFKRPFQNYAIVGPLTLLVLPLNLILSGIMFKLSRDSFREVGLHVRRNFKGFFSYLLLYQLFMSPVSVVGYVQELFKTKRNW